MDDFTYNRNKIAIKAYTKTSILKKIINRLFFVKLPLPCAASHVVLFHQGYYIDSNGIASISNYITIKVKDEDFVIKSINNKNGMWNGVFNRKQVTKIQDKLGINFYDVKIF